MPGYPHKYMLQLSAGTGYNVSSQKLLKQDLEQVRTEASMVAEIFGMEVKIYSMPIMGGQWQLIEKVEPPIEEDEDE